MKKEFEKQNIEQLNISNATIKILKENKIIKIGQLCKKTKTDLKKMNLSNSEVNKIDIELQLLGLVLKGTL